MLVKEKLNLVPDHSDFKAQRRYGNNRYICKSLKLNRRVYCFSLLEYYNFLLTEFDSETIDFCEQPKMNISALINGKERRSRPDMVRLDALGNLTVIECKPIKNLDDKRVKEQIYIQKDWCKKYGHEHILFTEKDINAKEILMSNLKFMHTTLSLLDNQTLSSLEVLSQRIIDYEEKTEDISVNNLLLNHPFINKGNYINILAWMYYQGEININIEKNYLCDESLVKFNV